MNKTIIINISGIIFHIEEDAYELLKSYMNDIKKHFGNSEDSFEIVTDIENRVAEMFSDILKKENKQVITPADVEGIILKMGKASDFGDQTEQQEDSRREFAQHEEGEIKKRLYRNSDDKIVGGVCSGIASYFNTDPLWIRLALVFAVVFFGTGILLYILLWMIMPEAKTRAEKLSMRGEKINISTIKNSVEEELSSAKKRVSENINQTRYSGGEQIRGFIQTIIELAGKVLMGLVKIVKVLAGAFITVFSTGLLVACTVVLLAGFGIVSSHHHVSLPFPLDLVDPGEQTTFYVFAFITLAIPLLMLMFLGLKIAFNTRIVNRTIGLSALGIWIVALMVTTYQCVGIASQFRSEGRLRTETVIQPIAGKTFYLNLANTSYGDHIDTVKTKLFGFDNGMVVVSSDEAETLYDNIDISIERSPSSEIKLITVYSSRGEDEQSAIRSAADIKYTFSQKDSVLNFDNFCSLKENSKWRGPRVEMTLLIPENMKLVIHDDVDRMIHNIYSGDCKRSSLRETFWTMTNYGLVCEQEQQTPDTTTY